MKNIDEMNYSEMVEEIARINKILKTSDSCKLQKDLYKYKCKLIKEINDYNKFRNGVTNGTKRF